MKVLYSREDGQKFQHCKGVDIITKQFMIFAAKVSKIIESGDWEMLVTQYDDNSSYEFSLWCGKKVSMIRTINMHTGYYEHDTFTVDEKFRGMGITQLMLEATVNICESLGVKKVITSAILDGRIVWLKRGFIPFNLPKYFDDLKVAGLLVEEKDRTEYWFTKENVKKHERVLAEISWHGYAYVETLKEFVK